MRHVVLLLLIESLALSAQNPHPAECQSCVVNKNMIRCDYYVARKAVKGKQSECEIYARYLDRDGTHANAAWYYLLAGRPKKALAAAQSAIAEGQTYAAEYAVFALRILGRRAEADSLLKRYADWIRKAGRYEQDRKTLAKLYPQKRL